MVTAESRSDHRWIEIVRTFQAEKIKQRQCRICGRSLVMRSASRRWMAVRVSVFAFVALDEETTQRWLNEPCPGTLVIGDDP